MVTPDTLPILSPSVPTTYRALGRAAGPRFILVQLMAISGPKNILSDQGLSQSGVDTGLQSYRKSKIVSGTPVHPYPSPTQDKPDDKIDIIVGDGDNHIWYIVGSV